MVVYLRPRLFPYVFDCSLSLFKQTDVLVRRRHK